MEPVLATPVSEIEVTFFLSGGCLLRLTTQLDFAPYIDVPQRSTHTPPHCSRTRPPMKRPAPIGNETEFQQWLASVLQAERERLRHDSAAHDFLLSKNVEVVMNLKLVVNDPAKETQRHEDQR
jgi:hypothetical protein